jgi:excisionase family DNA binding protein
VLEVRFMEGQYLDSDECAALIKATRTNVYTLASRRQIPHIKRGHRLLFDREEIIQWLEAQRRVSKAEAIRETVGA